jgi:hypothetical protein
VRDRSQVLELQSLQVDFLKTLHLRVLGGALECALGQLREPGQRLHLEVASVNELVDVLLVELLEFLFERTVVLGQSVFGARVHLLLGQVRLDALVV